VAATSATTGNLRSRYVSRDRAAVIGLIFFGWGLALAFAARCSRPPIMLRHNLMRIS
jgi:hypothetical protein